MNHPQSPLNRRWLLLAAAVLAMLFAGIIYAWSILKVPFADEFGWSVSALSLNFTLTMCGFCLGGILGSRLSRRLGVKLPVIIAALLAGSGLALTGILSGSHVALLYLTYAVMAGLGIGIAYNVIISTVNAWFPDKKGLCSGCLMMGFGASSLLLGNLASALFESALGWRRTYLLLGGMILVILVLVGLLLNRPSSEVTLPAPKKTSGRRGEDFEVKDLSTTEMLKRFTFWRAFLCLVFMTAVGSSVISFARDLALETGAQAALATTLVGVLSVCNGLGRILTGAVFDALGRRFTMLAAGILTIVAAAVTLAAVLLGSLPLCIVGLCLSGISYGTSPTISSAFTASFYGQKYFPTNFSITNCNLMGASVMATVCGNLVASSGGYVAPFILLLVLSVAALGLNISIRKP
jgi:OFA family oxalate/formate antiporter-like MFS transporter